MNMIPKLERYDRFEERFIPELDRSDEKAVVESVRPPADITNSRA